MTDVEEAHITVYGATGYTGGLICEELARRGRDFVAAGRSFERLQRLSSRLGDAHTCVPTLRAASVDDAESLDAMLRDTEVLINCAGPFIDIGPPVARAALRNDVHYLDTTGEQDYLRWLRDEIADDARRRGLVFMPACAFEYATGMMAADLAVEASARRIAVCYGSAGFSTSAATKKSIVRSIAGDGVTWRDGELVGERLGGRQYEVPFPSGESRPGVWIPGGEPILLPDLADVETAETCVVVGRWFADVLPWISEAMTATARVAQPLADRLVDWLDNRDVGEEGGDEETFPFRVVAFEPSSERWYAMLSGDDPYRATGRLAVEAATRLGDRDYEPSGMVSPPALFDTRDFAEAVDIDVTINPKKRR